MPATTERDPGRLRTLLWIALSVLLVGHVLVAFAPFRFDPPRRVDNGARLVDGRLLLSGVPEASTPEPPGWLRSAQQSSTLDVVVSVRPATAEQDGPARIFAVEADHQQADVMIGQESTDLVVRVRRPGSGPGGDPALVVPGALRAGTWHDVSVTASCDPSLLTVAVDDREPVTLPMEDDAFEEWDTGFRLALGDSLAGNRAWHGEIREARAGAEVPLVDYLDAGALEITDQVWDVPERLDDPIGLDADKLLAFEVLHFLGFVPVGLVVAGLCPTRPLLRATVFSVCFAVFLQIGKILFDTRHPALVDFVVESFGGFVGAWCWVRFGRVVTGSTEAPAFSDDMAAAR